MNGSLDMEVEIETVAGLAVARSRTASQNFMVEKPLVGTVNEDAKDATEGATLIAGHGAVGRSLPGDGSSSTAVEARKPPVAMFWLNLLEYVLTWVVCLFLAASTMYFCNTIFGLVPALDDQPELRSLGGAFMTGLFVLGVRSLIVLLHRCKYLSKYAVRTTMTGMPFMMLAPGIHVVSSVLKHLDLLVGFDVSGPGSLHLYSGGEAFSINLAVFLLCYVAFSGVLWARMHRKDQHKTVPSLGTYALYCLEIAFGASGGASLHYTVHVLMLSLRGPLDSPEGHSAHIWAHTVKTLLQFIFYLWFLVCVIADRRVALTFLARPSDSFDHMSLNAQASVALLAWAKNMAQWIWSVTFVEVQLVWGVWGSVFVEVLVLLVVIVIGATLARSTPDYNFHSMGAKKPLKNAFCAMNYYLLTFLAWTSWDEVLHKLDQKAYTYAYHTEVPSHIEDNPVVIAVNAIVLVLLLVVYIAVTSWLLKKRQELDPRNQHQKGALWRSQTHVV